MPTAVLPRQRCIAAWLHRYLAQLFFHGSDALIPSCAQMTLTRICTDGVCSSVTGTNGDASLKEGCVAVCVSQGYVVPFTFTYFSNTETCYCGPANCGECNALLGPSSYSVTY